jgi:hypothetical protein
MQAGRDAGGAAVLEHLVLKHDKVNGGRLVGSDAKVVQNSLRLNFQKKKRAEKESKCHVH